MKNYSKQREKIIAVLKNSCNHLTAEEIYITVKAEDPFLSRSTVYRNLTELVNNHVIDKISMQVGADKYEYKHGVHTHVICAKCGKIWDFDYEFDYSRMKKLIQQKFGIEILDKGMILEGICDNCQKE